MSLSKFSAGSEVKWEFTRAVTGFKTAKSGPESKSFNFAPDLGDVEQAYIATIALAGAGTATIDLQSFTNLIFEAVVLANVAGLFVLVELDDPADTDGSLTITPGAANGLTWFWGAGALAIPAGSHIGFWTPVPTTVDATHKALDLENPGTDAINATIIIPGGV